LLSGQPGHGPVDDGRFDAGLGGEHFEHVGRDVRRRRVGHFSEVAEGQRRHQGAVVVDVERSPSATPALHAQRPGHTPPAGGIGQRPGTGIGSAQGHHDLGRVVDVGVVVVGELERPASGLEVGTTHRPVARHPDLVREQPIGRRGECRVIRWCAGVGERDHGQGRVPHR